MIRNTLPPDTPHNMACQIMEAFSTETFITAYPVGVYTVDLYAPKYNLVIDILLCTYEPSTIPRSAYIMAKLGCTMVKVGCTDDIISVLGAIYAAMHQPHPRPCAVHSGPSVDCIAAIIPLIWHLRGTLPRDGATPPAPPSGSAPPLCGSALTTCPQRAPIVPREVVLAIIYAARSGTCADLTTLRSMSVACKGFGSLIKHHYSAIIEHYTVLTNRSDGQTYTLYGGLYSPMRITEGRVVRLPATTRGKLCRWYRNGRLHNDGDEPAVVDNGDPFTGWYRNGRLHRDGERPAIVRAGGGQEWYYHGLRHRTRGLPAVIRGNGVCEHWVFGTRIR